MNAPVNDPVAARAVAPQLQHDVEQFLFHEAALLDARDFTGWLDVLAEDLHYVVPTRYTRSRRDSAHEFSGPADLAHFDDDKPSIRQRIKRLQAGTAWSEEPASRTRHVISNVRVRLRGSGEIEVDSNFVLYRSRLERDVDWFVGERLDLLRRRAAAPGFEVVRRDVRLDHSLILASNLSVFF